MLTRTKNKILLSALIGLLFVTGCKKPQNYGSKIAGDNTVTVEKLLTSPTDYAGKTVSIEGKIVSECPSGCWFDVQQDTAKIYVDVNPSGIAIPQKVGSDVKVEGTVKYEDNKVSIIGTGVEIK